MARTLTPLSERFWAKVDKNPDGCWLWTGARVGSGYGGIGSGRRGEPSLLAHRVSYEIAHGPIPDGLFVCHSCDTPLCVRPDHLFAGSARDNSQDALVKGRLMIPTSRRPQRLTASQVAEIRARRASGDLLRILADEFGVSQATISQIALNRTW